MIASAFATSPRASDNHRDAEVPAIAATEQHLLLSVLEAARCLGISRTHLYEIIGRGEITTVRLGRRRMVRRGDLETFVASLTAVTPA